MKCLIRPICSKDDLEWFFLILKWFLLKISSSIKSEVSYYRICSNYQHYISVPFAKFRSRKFHLKFWFDSWIINCKLRLKGDAVVSIRLIDQTCSWIWKGNHLTWSSHARIKNTWGPSFVPGTVRDLFRILFSIRTLEVSKWSTGVWDFCSIFIFLIPVPCSSSWPLWRISTVNS